VSYEFEAIYLDFLDVELSFLAYKSLNRIFKVIALVRNIKNLVDAWFLFLFYTWINFILFLVLKSSLKFLFEFIVFDYIYT